MKLAYKLVRKMKSGGIRPLFINRTMDLPLGTWLDAEEHPTKGFAFRPGWHCTTKPYAPHLSMEGRVWTVVMIDDYTEFRRPESQGGLWYLANKIKFIGYVD